MSQAVDAAPIEKKKPKPTVEVVYNGVPKDFPDKPHEKVKRLLDETIAAFGVVENVHKMALFTAEGVELLDEETLEAAGVKAGDRLHLRVSVVKGG